MSDIAIRVEGLGKRYRLGQQVGYKTLRETFFLAYHTPTRVLGQRLLARRQAQDRRRKTEDAGLRSPVSSQSDHIWALKDVSFEVKCGEAVGIIGRNGSGKSTLLKILSRITAPTEGYAEMRGRVGSLLEIGTGFHPELTGRENVYLNGAIIGMKKGQIERRFDEIVAFAEIEQFLDTPVKRYSSGMYVRLAFAVAAHLQPEILIVDEVLAVGDTAFQKKCLGKMGSVTEEGRTVLFVSHNMTAVRRLCPRAILLDAGHVLEDGPADHAIRAYLESGLRRTARREWPELSKAPGNDIVRLRAVRVCAQDGNTTDSIDMRCEVQIQMEYDVLKSGHVLVPNLHFFNEEGLNVFVAQDSDHSWRGCPRPMGTYVSSAWVPGNFLAEGTMVVGAAISTYDPFMVHLYEQDAVAFQVVEALEENPTRGAYGGPMPGVVRPLLKWTTQFKSEK